MKLTKLPFSCFLSIIWVKVFKNGPSKVCGRSALKNLELYGLHIEYDKLVSR